MKNLFLIDASGYIFRAYYAIAPMTNAEGVSTNALFGFIRSVFKLIKDFDADHVVAVFDGPNNSAKRLELYSDYKANRKESPRDLPGQIAWAQQFCDAAGIPKLVVPGCEADDVMGSVAKWAADKGTQVYLCTSDKDMAQLVNEKVVLLNTHKDNLVIDHDGVVEKYGVLPEQIVDWLAMTGDASDNIPGLPGFGPKTASTLLKEFGSLDNILDNIDKVPGKKKQQTLQEESDMALLSRDLVKLFLEAEFPHDEVFFKKKDPHISELQELYQRMNFNTILKGLVENGDGSSIGKKKEEEIPLKYHLVDDQKTLDDLVETLREKESVCLDTETTSPHPLSADLVGIGMGCSPGEAWYIPVNGNLGRNGVLATLKPLLEDSNIGFYGHNIKYDVHVLHRAGIVVSNTCFDTMLASYILNSHSRQHGLDKLTLGHFSRVKIPTEQLIGKGKKQITMAEVAIPQVSEYCCEDVDYTCRLKGVLEKEVEERGMHSLLYDLELPLMRVLEKMERKGIYVDVDALTEMTKHLEKALAVIEKEIYHLAGEEFNIKSPKQLGHVLFEKMGIKPPKKTATGYSTNADVLGTLSKDHPIAVQVLEFRTLEKLRSTYTETLPLQVNPETGRIHCSFNQSVAATGRLTAQDPNLQNIPVRSEIGRQIRKAFGPQKEGWSFLAADYSQIELRLVAHLSNDPKLIDAFLHGADIHTATAAEMLGIPREEVTKEQRYQAKAVNFGIIYGQGAFGLSREIGIPVKEAANFIERYFERYQGVQTFIEECKEKVRNSGKAVTLTGRERAIPEIKNKNPNLRQFAERLAVNTPLQGTAADLIKMAMLQVDKRLDAEGCRAYMVLQVHDELIFEVPDEELDAVSALVREEMEGVFDLKIPLVVDVAIGKNWMEC